MEAVSSWSVQQVVDWWTGKTGSVQQNQLLQKDHSETQQQVEQVEAPVCVALNQSPVCFCR